MGKPAIAIELTAEERAELEGLANRRRTAQGLARRARIVLAAATGVENQVIAQTIGADANTVGKWRRRFAEHRIEGVYDEPRSGAPRRIGDEDIAQTIRLTLETTPPDATHWSLRSMAAAVGHAPSTIHRIWKAFCLQPHRSEAFKLSTDPLFVDKVRDIVGLYMAPPERAVVLCIDEKSQIQALDRTQPLLQMRPGQAERRTHDYTGTARCRCSPLSMRRPAKSSAAVLRDIGRASSAPSSTRSRPVCLTISMSTSSSTMCPAIRRKRSATGSLSDRAGRSTTPRHRPLSSTRSSASSPISPKNKFAAASIAPPRNWKPPSKPTLRLSTPTPGRSSGPNRPRTSWQPSSASVLPP